MKVAVLGSGSWGMTLAMLLEQNGHSVWVWFWDATLYQQAEETQELPDFLPGVTIPKSLHLTPELSEAVREADLIVVATPSHAVRATTAAIQEMVSPNALIVNVAKGIENDSLLTMSQVICDATPGIVPERVASLYGPTHAEEVSKGMASTIVAACPNEDNARKVQEYFMCKTLRVYTNTDILGVEYGGSLKNVIAIAAGILAGMGAGDNTLAALITRGSFEITRLGMKLGAREATFAGLSGIGDLIVTCLSQHSRNRHVGYELGRGRKLNDILNEMKMVAEGVRTAKSVHQLMLKTGVEMPISQQIYKVLFEDKDPRQSVMELMERDPVEERHSL
ncbi:MAG: NAD(P)-dependent glycerol-3-phosphate dehydrogenase [Candidatus Marinimicrobia bacterium]|nr:NAD(P)-dependent glycerol-3-phosphate dehydrogenase [Candidatus Neomarinimicrobiota bacterium]MCF7840624.1 NAD(P)-dependent glycerol-3-phosphate dehydrogenase [Candidatus Neomarinimicrobiota bacterium]